MSMQACGLHMLQLAWTRCLYLRSRRWQRPPQQQRPSTGTASCLRAPALHPPPFKLGRHEIRGKPDKPNSLVVHDHGHPPEVT